mgnify:CR=1 FL=1
MSAAGKDSSKRNEKLTKYRLLVDELRKRRPGYDITTAPVVIGANGGMEA